jgi:CubicO group peptidase (beta-lactamase class C family)
MSIKRIKRPVKFLALICILSVIVAGCVAIPATVVPSDVPASAAAPTAAPVPTAAVGAYWPAEGWRTSTPEAQGMDSKKLAEMLATIKEKNMNIHSFLVIRNGYLVSESYFRGYQQDTKHDMQSAGRSFTSTLVGIAIDKGYIDGVDHQVLEFFPERTFANLDAQKEAMTLEDVLTMRSGLEWQETPDTRNAQQRSPDWVQFLLDLPVVAPPGSQWSYCSGCSHILSAILQETTDMNPRDFAEQYFFKPLHISNVNWMVDPEGIPYGAGGFNLTPRDMAKLGYLFLRNGQWDGQQIVSSEWVKKATQRYAGVDEHFGYGYHWFTVTSLGGYAGYAALGSGGQIILVVPELDLVIVTTARTEESIFELIDQYVIPAVQKSQ